MKSADLKIGQLLKSSKFNITVEVVIIDKTDTRLPVKVRFVGGNQKVRTSSDISEMIDSFANDPEQWLYGEPVVPGGDDYLTLVDLEPVDETAEESKPKLSVQDVEIGDILVHPEYGLRFRVEGLDFDCDLLPVQVRLLDEVDEHVKIHAGDPFWEFSKGTSFWIFTTKDTVEEGEDDDMSLDGIIVLEDLVRETPREYKRGSVAIDYPTVEDLRKLSEENNLQKLLDRAYNILVQQAKLGERFARLETEFKKCILHFESRGFQVSDQGSTIVISW